MPANGLSAGREASPGNESPPSPGETPRGGATVRPATPDRPGPSFTVPLLPARPARGRGTPRAGSASPPAPGRVAPPGSGSGNEAPADHPAASADGAAAGSAAIVPLLPSRPAPGRGTPHAGSSSSRASGEPVQEAPGVDAIGELLLTNGLVTREQLAQALEVQRQRGGRVGPILVEMGVLSGIQLARTLAELWGLPYTELPKGDVWSRRWRG